VDDKLLDFKAVSPSGIREQLRQQFKPARPAKEPPPSSPPPAVPPAAETEDAEAASPEKPDPLPRPGEAYRVHGRHGNKPDLTLHFVTREFAYEGFSYASLERMQLLPSSKPGTGPVMVLRFGDTEVTLEGRHLHGLYNWIGLHRVPWLWEHPSPADFPDDKAALISRISINLIER
jgi:hypothetical protein